MEAESLKLRSEKMYQAELFQGDSGPGSVRIEIKPVGNEGIGKFLNSFLTFGKCFWTILWRVFGAIFWRDALNLNTSVGKLLTLFKAVLTQPASN